MFLNRLYGGMDEPVMKIIDVFMCKLRRKLADASNGKNYIETLRGRGYVLREHPVPSTNLTGWRAGSGTRRGTTRRKR